ncbi:MAG: VCBS repeat-containing protein, partial [Nitrospiraceae bacterium]|nr:VCBS repeat-containing protein [Nitrospiraceae bacterium]
AIAAGDFNRDGKTDLAVANYGSNNVSVLLGNGNGTFQPAANYPSGASPRGIATGDFNRDGKIDLAVANAVDNNLSILLGVGDGTFQAPVNYNAGSSPGGLVAGDFNSDGRPDIAVADVGGNISVLLLEQPVRRFATAPTGYYSAILDAYTAAADREQIQVETGIYEETLTMGRSDNVSLSLTGGYSGGFGGPTDYSTISGSLTISKGTLTVERIIVQ